MLSYRKDAVHRNYYHTLLEAQGGAAANRECATRAMTITGIDILMPVYSHPWRVAEFPRSENRAEHPRHENRAAEEMAAAAGVATDLR